MTDLELRKLAKMIVQEQARSSEWMNAFAKAQAHNQKPAETLVSAQKAATILGISVWQLYRIKDDEDGRPQFTYIKGDSKSSPIKFNSATLMEEYERYVAKKKKIGKTVTLRKAM